jgi:hypothetical protein
MRPAFTSGTLVLPKHVPYKEPENTTEWAPQRRPMQLNEPPAPRSQNYELLRQIERQEMLKGLVTEKGLKIDSDLNTKLFDIRVRDPITGVLTDRKVSLAEAITLPINDRIALLEQAVLAKGISAADLTALQAIIANNTRQLVLETLTRDQLAAVQRLVIKLGKPADHKEATLDRFQDAQTVESGQGMIQLFLLGQTPLDASGNPVDFVRDQDGDTIPLADVLTHLKEEPDRILDLESKSIIDTANAQAISPADYSKLVRTKAALSGAPSTPVAGPSSGYRPSPSPSPGDTFVEPAAVGADRQLFEAIMDKHFNHLDITWPSTSSQVDITGRDILNKWGVTNNPKTRYTLKKRYVGLMTIGEKNRTRALRRMGRDDEI